MTQYSNFLERGQRNVLMNGNFVSWPEGLNGPFTGSHTAAMTVHGYSTTGTLTPSGTSATKPNDNCNYVHCVTTDLGQASVTGTYHSHVVIKVEGYDFLPFIGNSATLSFWVRASVTGIYSIAFRNDANERSYVIEYTINQSNTWEYKVVHVAFNYSGGTWNYSNGVGVKISFTQACGDAYTTSSTDQWVTGNYIASTNQVNNIATAGNTFYMSQCQLELGDVATEYEHVDLAILNRFFQRYYSFIYNSHKLTTSVTSGTGIGYFNMRLPTPMRATPTVTTSGTQLWNPGQGWKTTSSVTIAGNWPDRNLTILYDNTYAGFLSSWPLLAAGTWFFDARL